MNSVHFERLHKTYGSTVALRDVSMEVHSGEVFGLLGPNGAGKTTLIRILMDIIRPDSGSIRLFGEAYHRNLLQRISYLPEERGLYRKHKVLEVMTYFAMLRGIERREARTRSEHWLHRIGLPEVGDWRVERLSKGMSQKVQIASALLSDPELCVLDEPFSGLDPVNLRLVQELVRERKQQGKTTILSTHQMNLVEALCDRVGLIHRGELVVYGEVSEIRRRFSQPEVRIAAQQPLPALTGVQRIRQEGGLQWRLLLFPETEPDEILRQLVGANISVLLFERVLAPLEDIFVQVVQEEVT